jgi:adenylosuccinate lyase
MKRIYVFVVRIEEQNEHVLEQVQHAAKMVTGNYNAHHVAFPQVNWQQW